MSRWWSRLFGLSDPLPEPVDEDLAKAIAHAKELIAAANESLRAAHASSDPDERDTHESIAFMTLTRLHMLAISYPQIKLQNVEDFEGDLRLIVETTKAMRAATWQRRGR